MPDEVISRDEVPGNTGEGRSELVSANAGRGGGESKPILALFRALASLTLAILLLAVYVPVLVGATLVEKKYGTNGTAAVHFAIYDSVWFTGIQVLLAVNILLAMLIRLPWHRRQVGFLMTHAGVLVLLAGALVSQQCGKEATLSVAEGHDAHVAYRNSYHFEIVVSPGEQGSGDRVQGSGFRVQGSGFGVQGSGVRVQGSGVRGQGSGVRDQGSGDASDIHHSSLITHHLPANIPASSAVQPICVPLVTGPFPWKKYSDLHWFPWHLPRRSEGTVYKVGNEKDGIRLEVLDYVTEPEPSVKARLTVDGTAETFDFTLPDAAAYDLGFAERPAPRVVAGRDRRAALALVQDAVDLGFAVHLKEFHRRLDPGSPMPSHYSSWVAFLDAGDPSRTLQESVVITLNAPVDFADPRTGQTYRLFQEGFDGPWTPEDPKFDKLVGNDRTRDHVYVSQLSVNYDPGRGLKYAGSFLLIFGIAVVYFGRRGQGAGIRDRGSEDRDRGRQPLAAWQLGGLLVALAAVFGACSAADAAPLDWNAWEHMPALGRGRVEPLDTFARQTVEAICGCESPTFALPDDARAARLFPAGRPRRFGAAELLFSWLIEPEAWEHVAFLPAPDEALRELLSVPLTDAAGNQLRYVSPHQVDSAGLRRWLAAFEQPEAGGKDPERDARRADIIKKIDALSAARDRFRQLTFNADLPKDRPRRFFARWGQVKTAWVNLTANLAVSRRISRDEKTRDRMSQSGRLVQELLTKLKEGEFSRAKIEPTVVALSRVAEKLRRRLARGDRPTAALGAELGRQAVELELALYDDGGALRLVPALNPAALEENRSPQDDASPWLAFRAMIFGSEDALRDYPRAELRAVREAFGQLRAAYFDRAAADRPAKFAAAMDRFAAAVRALGEAIEPIRDRLPVLNRDPSLIDATAYPPSARPSGSFGRPQTPTTETSLAAEIFYNRLDAFYWSWIASLAATASLALAVGKFRKSLFWLGLALLLIAQAVAALGLGLRMYVTGTIPLTGMFETVVFVALCVALLAVWFTLWPLFGPGLQSAWRMTGRAGQKSVSSPSGRGGGRPMLRSAALATLRAALIAAVFLGLVRGLGEWHDRFLQDLGWQRGGLFDLLPSAALGAAWPSPNDVLVWLIGLCLLGLAVYYVPRAVMTALMAPATVAADVGRRGSAAGIEAALQRRLFALAGAMVSLLATVLAYYAPSTVMHRSIVAPMAILRDNFWLAVHVATIMASYASAAIALVLGDLALGWYLFGSYRTVEQQNDECGMMNDESQSGEEQPQQRSNIHPSSFILHPSTPARRPPEACRLLAGFAYTAIQITVFLLAAGTILGAVWGDNAWGHFWSWDPKEVWALVSLLVYLLLLHVRRAGWAGDFGMCLTAVLGASAVFFTYYGVNYILGTGMHAYGSGGGGQWTVVLVAALQWLVFLPAAAVRYLVETGGRLPP
jgi:ABC-type transport system involved in cytochrome c biogenesis permease subunit